MKILIKNVLIKIYHLIDQIKQYYKFLKQIYNIIISKILNISLKLNLQIVFKAINDLINLHKFVFRLLIFDVYFQMIKIDFFFNNLAGCNYKKTMNKMKQTIILRQINDVFNTRNKFLTILVHDFLLNF